MQCENSTKLILDHPIVLTYTRSGSLLTGTENFLLFIYRMMSCTKKKRTRNKDFDCMYLCMRLSFSNSYKMLVLSQEMGIWLTMICFSWITGSSPSDIIAPLLSENNEFLLLGRAVAQAFSLTKCWICGGPMGLSSWPWVSILLEPDQLTNNYSSIENVLYDDTTPWPITYPGRGHFCLFHNQSNGIRMGKVNVSGYFG